jgi:hypothetical protein
VQGCDAPAGSTCLRQVLLLGNPAVWWGGTLAFLYAIGAWIGRRDWRYGVVVVGVLVTWLPWLRYDNRPIFSYYAIVIEPFLVIGLTLALGRILGPATASYRRRQVGAIVAVSTWSRWSRCSPVLADLDRPADHDAALAAADLVPPLDLAPAEDPEIPRCPQRRCQALPGRSCTTGLRFSPRYAAEPAAYPW